MAFRPQRDFELFGMSLLDLLCCGLGGMILLFLILVSQARVDSQSRERAEGRQFTVVRLLCPAGTAIETIPNGVFQTVNPGEHETIIDLVAMSGLQPTDRISLKSPRYGTARLPWITAPGAEPLLALFYQRAVHISPFLNSLAWTSDGADEADAFVVIVGKDGHIRAYKGTRFGPMSESPSVTDVSETLASWGAPPATQREIETILPAMKALLQAAPNVQASALWAWKVIYMPRQEETVPDGRKLLADLESLHEEQKNANLTETQFVNRVWPRSLRSNGLKKVGESFASVFADVTGPELQPSGCKAHVAGPDFKQPDLPVYRTFCVNAATCVAGSTGCVQCAPSRQ